MRARAVRDFEKEKWWRAAFERLAASGLTTKEFCKREGLSQNTLNYWRATLKARDEILTAKHNRSKLVPVRVIQPRPIEAPIQGVDVIEIRTPDGMEIRVPVTCTAEVVGELIARLRGTPC